MKISVIGLGYVGAVAAACFAAAGHDVVGVDVSQVKVDLMTSGRSPLSEFGLEDLVGDVVRAGRLTATNNLKEAIDRAAVVFISVGTPSLPTGDADLTYVDTVSRQLGALLRECPDFKTIVVTSTIPPGTLRRIQASLEEHSGGVAGHDFGLCFSPEFLREGSAIADFSHPERVVIGSGDSRSTELLRELFAPFGAPIIETTPEIAEVVKFAANAWHAVKVTFANEIGRFCASVDVDSHEVMDIFKQDKRLNVSENYLTPGFAFGGSCLPKDLRTLTYRARVLGSHLPMLEGVLPSNANHRERALELVQGFDGDLLILGLAFKAGTDDLRESPAVPLAEALLGKGRHVRVYDEHVRLDRLVGANLTYVQETLPHLADVLATDLAAEARRADVIVVAQANPLFASTVAELDDHQTVVDLSGVARRVRTAAHYVGLAW